MVLQEMVLLEEQTQEVLIQGDARRLDELNQRKNRLMEALGALELQRSQAVPGKMTLREYIDRLRESSATGGYFSQETSLPGAAPGRQQAALDRSENPLAELESLRANMLQLFNALQRLQGINKHLLQHNLKFITQTMSVLFPQQQEEPLYDTSGEMERKNLHSAKLLDSNA